MDTTQTKLFIGGLSFSTTSESLAAAFADCGPMLEAVVICERVSGRSKGFGFVTFVHPHSAQEALARLGPAPVIDGRKTSCNLACLGARSPPHSRVQPPGVPHPMHNVPYMFGQPIPGTPLVVDASGCAYVVPPYYPPMMHAGHMMGPQFYHDPSMYAPVHGAGWHQEHGSPVGPPTHS